MNFQNGSAKANLKTARLVETREGHPLPAIVEAQPAESEQFWCLLALNIKPQQVSCNNRTLIGLNSKIVKSSLYVLLLIVIFVLWVARMATAVTISSSISDPTIVSIPLSLHPFWPLFVIIFYAMRLLFFFVIVFATLHTFLTLQAYIWQFTAF